MEVEGAHYVVAVSCSDSNRVTLALTVSADGWMLPPHFAFKGVPGGPVHEEVPRFVDAEDATVSVQPNAWIDERVMLGRVVHL